MRKLIFSFILLSTLLVNCGKDSGTDDPNNPNGNGGAQTTLTISPNELTFKSEGEEKAFAITSNSAWIITNPSTWCKINPTQGNGNSTITAIADPSEEYDDRNFNLTIKAGETTKVVTVTQKKKDAIILTKEKYDIPTEGDNITVEVKSNITYSTIIPAGHNEWIKQVETKQLGRGLETKNLNFQISANPTTNKREGIIVIKDNSSSLADTIHVYQAQKDELILTQDTYNVSSEGENINVELRSNVDYEVIIPEDVKDWVNRITSRSSRVDNLIFNIAANPTYDNRSAKVIIKDKNSELADTLNINQTQVNAIILTQEKYEIPSEGQNIKIEVKSNIKYDIIIPDNAREWIKQIQSRALITNIINLSISANTSYEQRAAEIVVKDKSSNLSDTIRITQKQNNIIILTQKEYDIPAEGQQISIEIKSNIEYDILLSTDAEKWIEKIDLSRALITNTLNYNILPNTTYNERKAEIIIKDKGSDLSDTVKIVQAPKSDIFIGDVTFKTEQDLIDFKEMGYKKVKGNVSINPYGFKTLQKLDNLLTEIEGSLILEGTLTNFDGLYGLKTITEDLVIQSYLTSFAGLSNLETIGGNFKIIDSSSLNALTSFEGLSKLNYIGGDFEVNASSSSSSSSLEALASFKGLENLEKINGNFKIIASSSSSSLNALTSFEGLSKLNYIGGDFEVNASSSSSSLKALASFKGLENLEKINGNFKIIASSSYSSSLNALTSFEGLSKLNYIGGDFEVNASSSSSSSSLEALASFKGLENLEKINGNFKIIASSSYSSSLNALTSFEGLSKLNYIGGDFEVNASSSSSSSSLEALASFKGLENLEKINGNFKIIASSSSSSLNALTSFEGLSKLNYIGGDFEVNPKNLKSLSLDNLTTIGGDANINIDRMIETLNLNKLNSINGNLYIRGVYGKMTSLDLISLTTITGNLTITECPMLNNIDGLTNLTTVKNISITSCPKLYDFCVLKNVVKNNDYDFYTTGNGYNPTKYQLLNGECSKLPEE